MLLFLEKQLAHIYEIRSDCCHVSMRTFELNTLEKAVSLKEHPIAVLPLSGLQHTRPSVGEVYTATLRGATAEDHLHEKILLC